METISLFYKDVPRNGEWFHDMNVKQEVINARVTIASVLTLLKKYFPCNEDNTNGYRLPKMHGMTNMQTYIYNFIAVESISIADQVRLLTKRLSNLPDKKHNDDSQNLPSKLPISITT